jgi:mono/diheme cytochrome c family protein
MDRGVRLAVASLGVLGLLAGCGSARRSEPLVGPPPLRSAEVQRGERVFMHHCHQCHPGGEAGLAPSINDKPLPGFMIKTQVRLGVGAMPGFSPSELSDAELDDLISYLSVVRRHGGEPTARDGRG